jgi:CRP/FNR family transcriptional regulator
MIDQADQGFVSGILSFWPKLSTTEHAQLLNGINTMHYAQGQSIHRGETDCIGVLLIKSGSLRTYLLSEDGREVTLFRLKKGDVCILSASCILKNITFEVHIDAEADSDVLIINSAILANLAEQNIYVENFINQETVSRFSDVMWAMEQILFMSFDKRLAVFLLDELSQQPEAKTSTIQMTHEQIAKYVGSAREVVSRMLKYFANEGYVELSRGGVKVINQQGLRNLL